MKTEIKSLLNYNPETGIFHWKKTIGNVIAGTEAGSKNKQGYIFITINGKKYRAHSMALFLSTGIWPDMVDHKNRIRDDNRLLNLCVSNKVHNGQNQVISKRNKSGHLGVVARGKRWMAFLRFKGKQYHLGNFKKLEDAVQARRNGEIKFNFNKGQEV